MSKKWLIRLLFVLGFQLAGCQSVESSATVPPTASLLPLPTASATNPPELERDATPGVQSIGPTPTPFVHIIQQGETMLGIALRYGVSLEDLILVNPGVDPGFLTIGQSLRIPGEEGQAVDTLLPTPTPVPVNLSPVVCYPALSGALTCLLECHNEDGDPIRGLTVLVRLFNQRGEETGFQLANAPLDTLLTGQSLPLSAHFTIAPSDFRYASASVLSAIRVPELEASFLTPGEELEWVVDGLGTRFVSVAGSIDLRNLAVTDGDIMRVVGIAHAEDGQLVGYQILDIALQVNSGSSSSFQFEIFSLGPTIAEVDLVAEVAH